MTTKIQLLELGVPEHRRAATKRTLEAGPWCWPETPIGVHNAEDVAGNMPATPIGAALVVTEAGSAGALFLYKTRGGDGDVVMNPSAAAAVDRALALLGHSCGALRELPERAPSKRLQLLDKHVLHGESPDSAAVRGDSLGLAVLLAQASSCLRLPVPSDLAAMSSLEDSGATRGVDGIRRKIEALRACAPRVKQILVAAQDADEARRSCEQLGVDPDECVVIVERASDAIEAAFGKRLPMRMVEALPPANQKAFIEQLLQRALRTERDRLLSWRPVWQMAAAALDVWDLEPDGRDVLRLVHAIAVRHDNANVDETLCADWTGFRDWVTSLHPRRRLPVLAHVVQQNTDRCVPDNAQLAELMRTARPDPVDNKYYWMLRGAEARRAAVQGLLEEAWATQLEASAFFIAYDHTQMSFQLSELYKLAGFFEDAGRLAEVDTWNARTQQAGGLHKDGHRYVRLARGRAEVQIGCATSDADNTLQEIAADTSAPGFVRASAMVWLAVSQGWNSTQFEMRYRSLTTSMKGNEADLCKGYPAQWRLLTGPDATWTEAFEDLCRHERTAVASMLSCRPEEIEGIDDIDVRFIAERFPY